MELTLESEPLAAAELQAVEASFRDALAGSGHGRLRVLGYGEISTVVAVESASGGLALKRLPPFDGEERFRTYRALFEEYLEELRSAGLDVVPSRLQSVSTDDALVGYCVQPILPATALGPRLLAEAGAEEAVELATEIVERILRTVTPQRGLDGQLSNWAKVDGEWLYLDVTTPLLRDGDGADRLDAELFLASLPAVLRGVARRFLLRSITGTYFDPRQVVVDFLANLVKERLARLLPALVEAVRARLRPAVREEEVLSYYRRDARLWAALLALRRLDRFWQRKVRRRPYPFLLPGRVER